MSSTFHTSQALVALSEVHAAFLVWCRRKNSCRPPFTSALCTLLACLWCRISFAPDPPRFVYLNLPELYLPLTLEIQNHPESLVGEREMQDTADPNQPLSIVFENRGRYHQTPRLNSYELLDKLPLGDGRALYKQLLDIAQTKGISISREEFFAMVVRVEEGMSKERGAWVRYFIDQTTAEEGKLVANKTGELVPVLVEYRGKRYPISRLAELRASFEADQFPALKSLPGVFSGEYLYRAVTTHEWEEIQRNGAFLIRNQTNFEDKIGPQVEHFASEPGYAGKVIRIKVTGPYFRRAGMQVPRVESFLPSFAPVDVLENQNWVPIPRSGSVITEIGSSASGCGGPIGDLGNALKPKKKP